MKTRRLMLGGLAVLALVLGTGTASAQEGRGMFGGRGDRGGSSRGSSGGSSGGSSRSTARSASSQVTAVADMRSNSLVVVAPEEMMDGIAALIDEIETLTTDLTQFRVFPLQYAEADEVADALQDLFEPANTSSRSAARRVRAEAEDGTNSVMVCAPKDIMPTIEGMIKQIDTMSEDVTEVRVFPLRYADAEETATMINDVFEEQSRSRSSDQPRRFGGGPFGSMFGGRGMRDSGRRTQGTDRRVQEQTVTAVADTRTNSVVVRAAGEIMSEIAKMVDVIDKNPARDKKVHVYDIKNANVEELQAILEGLFGSADSRSRISSTGSTRTGSTRTGSSTTRGATGRRSSTGSGGTSTRGSTGGGSGAFGTLR